VWEINPGYNRQNPGENLQEEKGGKKLGGKARIVATLWYWGQQGKMGPGGHEKARGPNIEIRGGGGGDPIKKRQRNAEEAKKSGKNNGYFKR